MDDASAFAAVLLAVSALGLVRNQIVYQIRMRRLAAIHELCQREVDRPDFIAVMERRYASVDSPSYGCMVLDLTRWTYRQFYPAEVE